MTLNTHDKDVIRSDFATLIAPKAQDFVTKFYEHLFKLDVELKFLFKPDLGGMPARLAGALAHVVPVFTDGTDQEITDLKAGGLEQLGEKHAGFHVRERDFGTLIVAMTGALHDFGVPYLHLPSWGKLFGEITIAMIAGLRKAQGR